MVNPDGVFTARTEGLASGGEAFVHIADKTVFIAGAAPDEVVKCRITSEYRSWARAELLEVIKSSESRVQPICACYGICGGCNLQHLHYPAQVAAKSSILVDTFRRIGGIDAPEPLVFQSPQWEYRNRMRFHYSTLRPGAGSFGLKARGSDEVIKITDCPIADPGIRRMLQGQESRAGELVPPQRSRFTVYSREGLLLSEGGRSRGKIRILDRELTIDAALFFQSNGAMLESLISGLQEIVSGGMGGVDHELPMADIYGGVGTFAAFLGGGFPRVDLVEENSSALSLARENTKALAGETTVELYALTADDWVNNTGTGRGGDYGFVVVDPPRRGLSPRFSRWLAAAGPPVLAYVSCNPATLARDSGILLDGGYELTELRFYDFYPQTAHIESIAVFRR